MSKPKIAIFGASGFIGAALCERLFRVEDVPFRACIHSFANAARIARFPIELVQADVLDYAQVAAAVRGVDTVVNCAWGNEAAMVKGLNNIVKAIREEKVRRFIHLGSISVHEGYADQATVSEDAAPKPLDVYGRIKKVQDDIVFGLHKSGVPCVILAAGRIIGPYAPFVLRTLDEIRSRPIVLVDEGRNPSNHVHVDNVAQSIITCLNTEKGWGERYFVTEPGRPMWSELFSGLGNTIGVDYRRFHVSRDEVLRHQRRSGGKSRGFVMNTVRGLASGQFRKGMAAIPLFSDLEQYAYRTFTGLHPNTQRKIKARLQRPIVVEKESRTVVDIGHPLAIEQTRRTYFSPERITVRMGYTPVITNEEGMEMIAVWCRFAGVA